MEEEDHVNETADDELLRIARILYCYLNQQTQLMINERTVLFFIQNRKYHNI